MIDDIIHYNYINFPNPHTINFSFQDGRHILSYFKDLLYFFYIVANELSTAIVQQFRRLDYEY